jgi:hypothetical protein
MTPLFPAVRAAEEFDGVLEGRATTAVAERYAELAATVQVLREQPEMLPRTAFVADLRERLMLAAETDLVPAPPVVRRLPSKSRRNRRVGTIAASLVIVGGSAGMAAAASGAQPGQALYPIKRGVEQVRVAAHVGDASKGSALLGEAGTRLDELQGLVQSGADRSLIEATVADFRSSTEAGADKLFTAYQADADAAHVSEVRSFTAHSMDEVAAMAVDADPSTAGALRDTADTLADIDQQATTLCATCGAPTALTPPSALAAGSGAAVVNNLIARPVQQAQSDIATQTAITQAQVARLKDQVQTKADELSAETKSGQGTTASRQLTGTLTSEGDVVPSLVDQAASTVTNLVTGVTGSVTAVTGGGSSSGADGSKDPVGKALDKAGAAVGGATDGLTGTLGSLTKGLTPSPKN